MSSKKQALFSVVLHLPFFGTGLSLRLSHSSILFALVTLEMESQFCPGQAGPRAWFMLPTSWGDRPHHQAVF
jgi:hypothetical protein